MFSIHQCFVSTLPCKYYFLFQKYWTVPIWRLIVAYHNEIDKVTTYCDAYYLKSSWPASKLWGRSMVFIILLFLWPWKMFCISIIMYHLKRFVLLYKFQILWLMQLSTPVVDKDVETTSADGTRTNSNGYVWGSAAIFSSSGTETATVLLVICRWNTTDFNLVVDMAHSVILVVLSTSLDRKREL